MCGGHRMVQRYPTDLTEAEWTLLGPLIPAAKRGSRPRTTDMREVINAIFYVLRGGCQWRLLPKEFPPHQTVVYTTAADKPTALNLSQFVEDQNDLAIGQILPFWLCSRSLGLRQHTRSSRPARTPSGAESSAGTERTRGIPASSSYRGPEPRVGTASVKKTGTPPGSHARDHGHTPSSYD